MPRFRFHLRSLGGSDPGPRSPPALGFGEMLPDPVERARELPPRDLVAEAVLELVDQHLEVERDAAVSRVLGMHELVVPAELARDQGGVGEVGVEDGAALEAVRERIPDRYEPVARRAFDR